MSGSALWNKTTFDPRLVYVVCAHVHLIVPNGTKQDWLSVLMKIACFMACAAIASGAETITVKTKAAHTHTVNPPNQYVLKTCFSQPYWVVLEIYDAPSAAKKEKSLAPGEPICPAWWCGGPVTVAAIKGEKKKKRGARGDLTPTSHQPNGPQTACHAVRHDQPRAQGA